MEVQTYFDRWLRPGNLRRLKTPSNGINESEVIGSILLAERDRSANRVNGKQNRLAHSLRESKVANEDGAPLAATESTMTARPLHEADFAVRRRDGFVRSAGEKQRSAIVAQESLFKEPYVQTVAGELAKYFASSSFNEKNLHESRLFTH